MPRKRSDNPAATFQATIRAALEHLRAPAWLAAHSPLATAYFLGERAAGQDNGRAAVWGIALRDLLGEALNRLWDGPPPPTAAALIAAVEEARRESGNSGDRYAYLLLELRYFRRHFAPGAYPAQATDIPVFLNVSTTRFFVHLDRAIDRLGEELLRLAHPALRPEQPPAAALLLGRERELGVVRNELAAGRSVTLSGAAGVGKTTLGANVVVAGRPPGAVFWYTFLPNFNDNLPALLFAIGHFLHGLGGSTLWRQLLADAGRASEPEQALGMLRADLARLPGAPLFCFDEVDLLHASDGDARSVAHARLLAFLEALSLITPTLLIGQRGYIDTPVHIALEPLDASHTAMLLTAAGLALSRRQAERVYEVTGGLPRLVDLVIALVRDGDDLDEIVRLHLRADARPLFNRLWRRLDRAERELLIALSVFRGPAPADAWPMHAAAQRSLIDRRLLMLNDGEMGLMPFFRKLVYEELRAEQRETAHAGAAGLRAVSGEFTAAAYHYACAGEPEKAVAVWSPNSGLEIERGQAGAALDIFSGLSAKRLPRQTAGQLKVIQNQLYLLAGQSQRVIDNMNGFNWQVGDVMAAEAHYLEGQARQGQGDDELALEAYERAITATLDRLSIGADSISSRSRIYLNSNLESALREARRSRLFAELLDGFLAMTTGRFDEAQAHYEAALQFDGAGQADDRIVAELHKGLGYIAGYKGDVETAERHYGIAINYYRRIGDTVKMAGTQADLAGVYLNLGQFERFVLPAEHSLQFFESIRFEPRIVQLSVNLAEAYLETGRLNEAAAYANRALQMEVPRHRPYALYTLGLVHQRQGRPEYAAAAFADGIRTAQNNHDRFIEAYLHRLDGRLRLEQEDGDGGRVALERALAMFTEMGINHEVEVTRGELAELYADDVDQRADSRGEEISYG